MSQVTQRMSQLLLSSAYVPESITKRSSRARPLNSKISSKWRRPSKTNVSMRTDVTPP